MTVEEVPGLNTQAPFEAGGMGEEPDLVESIGSVAAGEAALPDTVMSSAYPLETRTQ